MKQKKKTTISINTIKLPLWVIIICLLSFFGVMVRLCYLSLSQNVDGVDIQNFASNRNSTTEILPAKRGTIYDVNGNVLAQTVSSYTLIAYLEESRTTNVNDPQHVVDIEYTATELSKVIDLDYDTIVKYLSKDGVYQTEFGPAGRGLTELQKSSIDDLNLPGIDFIETQKRYYPYGDFLSYTIGYAIEETYEDENGNEVTGLVGQMGIEKQYDDILRGIDGYTFYQRDRNGYRIAGTKEVTVKAVDGSDVYLSIDANVQLFLEQALDNAENSGYSWDWYTLLVADADTGAILGSGENIITKTVYPQISSSFYITPAGGTITDAYTRGYVDDMVVINKLIDMGYSDDVAAIVGEHCYNISPSKVSGSTFLGRINAKMSAVKNGKVVVDTMEDEKGVMKL